MAKRRKIKKEKREVVQEEVKKPIIEYKPPSEEEKKKRYREGLIKTLLPSFLGIVAGIISVMLGNSFLVILGMLAIFIGMQYPFYLKLGIKKEEFGKKDWFYVGFMTFDFWLITAVLLMN